MATAKVLECYQKEEAFTYEEALRIMKAARTKEYWVVDSDNDNKKELQNAIDVTYNSVEGNNYEVNYEVRKNKTRLVINCKICNRSLAFYDCLMGHDQGKSHQRIRQQMVAPADPNIGEPLEIKPLNAVRNTYPQGSLEYKIDSCCSPILGIQFLYKETISGKDYFTCQLCMSENERESSFQEEMLEHLKSKDHNIRYMKLKFNFDERYKIYEEEIRKIEEFEGRIHGPIIDFSPHKKADAVNQERKLYARRESEIGEASLCQKDHYITPKMDETCQANISPSCLQDFIKEIYEVAKGDFPEEVLKDDAYFEIFMESMFICNSKLEQQLFKQGPKFDTLVSSTSKIRQILLKLLNNES